MKLLCFRAAGLRDDLDDHTLKPRPAYYNGPTKTKSRILHRHGSADSRASTSSNGSISKLPPCKRTSDAEIAAKMMPVPPDPRPSKCLRLSQPKTYSNIVSSMKAERGSRDWRNFAVFPEDDVDLSRSAVDEARRKADEYEQRWRQLNNISFDGGSDRSIDIDTSG